MKQPAPPDKRGIKMKKIFFVFPKITSCVFGFHKVNLSELEHSLSPNGWLDPVHVRCVRCGKDFFIKRSIVNEWLGWQKIK
jgi:hypothetical protein